MSLSNMLHTRLRLPVLAAPMFIVSNPDLVVAQCTAGIIGSFPALNARPPSLLDSWLAEIVERLAAWNRNNPDRPAAPFAVNQIVHKTNLRLDQDLELCVKYKVPIIITSLGARPDVNAAVHSYGGIVLQDVINDVFAHKAVDKGADGLILVSAGAGGHAGNLSPFALMQEVRAWFKGPVVLSGAIANGASILAAQALGADLAYIGSAFIATDEANAVPLYKQMIVDSSASDIVYTNFFTGVHGNYLRAAIVRAGLDPSALSTSEHRSMDYSSGEGAKPKAWRDVWGAGQGIGVIHSITSVHELVARFQREYTEAWQTLLARRAADDRAGVAG